MSATPLLRFLGHSTVLLEMDGVRVLTDPLLVDRLGPLHRHAGKGSAAALNDLAVDVVLISHGHHDHLHLPSLRRLSGPPQIIAPAGLGRLLRQTGHEVVEIAANESVRVGPLQVTAVRAVHSGRRLLGPSSETLGFRIEGSVGVYFAGDTDLFPEMSDLAGTVDVALLPVWGWGPRLGVGHLDPLRAAEAVVRIRPRLAMPIHWGTFYPFAFARIWPHPLGDPPKDFAREVARIAPGTEVRIVAPGEATDLSW